MFPTSFQTSQNNTQRPLLSGDTTQPSEKRVKNSSSEETQPNEVVGVSHASPGAPRRLIDMFMVVAYAARRDPLENRLAWLTRSPPVTRRACLIRWIRIQVCHIYLLLRLWDQPGGLQYHARAGLFPLTWMGVFAL